MNLTQQELAKFFDHTLLDSAAVEADIRALCEQAVQYGFFTACVQPRWVALCADILRGTDVKVCSVAGFPFGTDSAKIKAAQAEEVIMAGADEVDMVADIAAIKSGDESYLRRDMKSVLDVCRSMKPVVPLKVIIEANVLTTDQIRFVCRIAQEVGVDFVKSNTGFHKSGGAQLQAVQLMIESAPGCKVKASAGIKTLAQTIQFIEAGVSRIGSSASVQIMEEFIATHGNG
ncbi:MAG: deoxyribose-phosphate aldolase [Planctomycetota bacterium]